ncbi:hypothetical protein MELB17_10073 [Marinobacter sp. ELB17]|nr:hypothetical protein MELB17_10073 [Marinobacter sp. ELB17]
MYADLFLMFVMLFIVLDGHKWVAARIVGRPYSARTTAPKQREGDVFVKPSRPETD